MEDLQKIIVDDHIGRLLREGDALRTERQVRAAIHARDGDGQGVEPRRYPHAVRVRLGHWLIGVGAAVAGTSSDHHVGRASRPV